MKMASVKYLVGEGFKNTWVNRLMTIASVGVLMACMVIIGLALLIGENANRAMGNLEEQNVVMAYMKDYSWALYGDEDVQNPPSKTSSGSNSKEKADKNGIRKSDYVIHNEEEALALCKEIEKLPNVKSAEFISAEEGLKTATKDIIEEDKKNQFNFLNDKYGNPLSGAAKITMDDMARFDETLEKIKKMEGISSIESYEGLAEQIAGVKNGLGIAGVWIIGILLVIALVIVSNTIRVTMYNRKLEIGIMKAVGATDTFVRIPFVVEGIVMGLISAILAEGVLYFCYRVATEKIIAVLNADSIVEFSEMAWLLLAIFIAIGLFAGIIGSVIMISKYLRKEGSEFAAI